MGGWVREWLCVCVCVCMRMCVYVCMYVCMCVCVTCLLLFLFQFETGPHCKSHAPHCLGSKPLPHANRSSSLFVPAAFPRLRLRCCFCLRPACPRLLVFAVGQILRPACFGLGLVPNPRLGLAQSLRLVPHPRLGLAQSLRFAGAQTLPQRSPCLCRWPNCFRDGRIVAVDEGTCVRRQ